MHDKAMKEDYLLASCRSPVVAIGDIKMVNAFEGTLNGHNILQKDKTTTVSAKVEHRKNSFTQVF